MGSKCWLCVCINGCQAASNTQPPRRISKFYLLLLYTDMIKKNFKLATWQGKKYGLLGNHRDQGMAECLWRTYLCTTKNISYPCTNYKGT